MIPAKVSRTQNKLGLQHLLDSSRVPVRYLSLLLKLTVIFFSMVWKVIHVLYLEVLTIPVGSVLSIYIV